MLLLGERLMDDLLLGKWWIVIFASLSHSRPCQRFKVKFTAKVWCGSFDAQSNNLKNKSTAERNARGKARGIDASDFAGVPERPRQH